MRSIFATIIAAMLVGCATAASDPIDQLVTNLSASHLWENGMFPDIKLPATASTEEVVTKIVAKTAFENAQHASVYNVTKFKILKIRRVRIPGSLPDQYTAVLIQTDFGERIVLFKYVGEAVGWWSRVYDAKTSA
jgi:hypothetical protein